MASGLHPFAQSAAAGEAHLRLLETTDLHAFLRPYDYYADRVALGTGLARLARLIAEARAEAANCLLFDDGDFLLGNPIGDWPSDERRQGPHPVIAAMNALGYDGVALGNHDLDHGLDFLQDSLQAAAFPVLCANLAGQLGARPVEDSTILPAVAILQRALVDGAGQRLPCKLGVIGLIPPQVTQWCQHHLHGRTQSRDMIETAAAWSAWLKGQGCDLVLVLAHSGLGEIRPAARAEHACLAIAGLPDVDLVMAGHSHGQFPSPAWAGIPGIDSENGLLQGKPAVMAGFWGSHLGVIDLRLRHEAGHWRLIGGRASLRAATQRGPAPLHDPAFMRLTRSAHQRTLDRVRRPVGETGAPLTSFFALVADIPAQRLIAEVQRQALQQVVAGGALQDLPILSAFAPYRAGGHGGLHHYTDIPAGPLSLRHLADLYPYPNQLCALVLTGRDLAEWLERSAALFHQLRPDTPDQPLIDTEGASYNFDMIDGLSYRIDLSQPRRYDVHGRLIDDQARRITALSHAGRPLHPEARFLLATSNYRASGGGHFPGAATEALAYESKLRIRDLLVAHVRRHGRIEPRARGDWAFAPLAGASALFLAPPAAAAHLAPHPEITALGMTGGGFRRYRLRL